MLVVDDSALVRRTVQALLEQEGYEIHTASSGEEAFELCCSSTFDLVVSDVTMGALSGVQLCRVLRSDPITADLPVVLLTAADDPRTRFWGRHAGADEYVPKDKMRAELGPALAQLLADKAPRKRVAPRADRTRDPLRKVAEVLERHLFDAVVTAEVRDLMDRVEDRDVFMGALLRLAGELAEYDYLVLRLDGVPSPTWAVHARGPWPSEQDADNLSRLGVPQKLVASTRLVCDDDVDLLAELVTGERLSLSIACGGRELGELYAFGGRRRLAADDVRTLTLIADSMGVMVHSLLLVEETHRLASVDELTGLKNRRRVAESLEEALLRAERYSEPLCVALMDIDHFKRVNDEYGHNVGDTVLRQVACVLRGSVRNVDVVGRWGGEEFLVLLPQASEMGGRVVAERLRARLAAASPPRPGPATVTASIGVACYRDGMTGEMLVDRADQALYRAKARGRNRVEIYREED